MTVRRDRCLLCLRKLQPHGDGEIQIHPRADDCEVIFTDAWGVSIDLDLDARPEPELDLSGAIQVDQYTRTDDVLTAIFKSYDLPRLGGASSGKGWTGFALYQRCPHAWANRYMPGYAKQAEPGELMFMGEAPAIAVGALIHTFLALHYSGLRPESPYANITAVEVHDKLLSGIDGKLANPTFVNEAWRVFCAYTLYYKFDQIVPLAIEHDLKDPRTGESCRFDMIAFHPEAVSTRPAGTYIYEFKSHGQFSRDNLEGYLGDGEILGQIALWKKLALDKRFGELKGVCVDILGKQKEPKFHRTWVPHTAWLIDQHLDDLKKWDGLIQLAKSTRTFPRSRNNCIGRWGRCQHFEECAALDRPELALMSLGEG